MTNTLNSKPNIVKIVGQFPVLSETFILNQITGMIDRGINIQIWALHKPNQSTIHPKVKEYDLLNKVIYLKLPHHHLKPNSSAWLKEFCNINAIPDLSVIDAFQVHFGPVFNTLEPLFKIYRGFTMVSFHGYDASRYFKEHGDNCYSYLFQRADKITTVTHAIKNELVIRGCNPAKIRVHRSGTDLNLFKRGTKKSNKIVILTVGRFVEKKGIGYAIAAFALCRNKENVEYRIIGDGELRAELEFLIQKLGLSDQVLLLGAKARDEVAREMSQADIFVLTCTTANNGDKEGLPGVLIEAHASSLPVISTYHAGIPELIEDGKTGLLVNEKDIQDIAQAMDLLIKNKELRDSLTEKSFDRVSVEFNIEILNDTLVNMITEGIEGKNNSIPIESTSPRFINATLQCPICGNQAPEFLPFGVRPRPNAQCPACGSLERHRLLWLFLHQKTNLFTIPRLKVLDVAPSPCLSERIKNIPGIMYLSIDLHSPHAMRKMDLTNLLLPDNYFDCIICCHVLEHIPDDKKAMQELLRVLKPGGWAILQVPLRSGYTQEGTHITDPAERTRLFGQHDHVRYYGTDDYKERLESQGFTVDVIPFAKSLPTADMQRYAMHSGDIYFCKKEAGKGFMG